MAGSLDRLRLVTLLRESLQPLPRVLAMWEGGSAAWGRLDEWSDLDVLVLVEDDFVEAAFEALEAALSAASPISLRYVLPRPTWHGHDQRFYQLRDAGPFLMLDVVVLRRSAPERFLERERHGEPVVYFDKTGDISARAIDRGTLRARISARLEQLRVTFPLFQPLVRKELLRGNDLDALAFYQSQTLAPLLMLLRMRHCPARFDFGLRYVDRDLPPDVTATVRALWFVSRPGEIEKKQREAEALFERVLGELAESGIDV
jgi:predicted nucleotidyltransferase